MNHASIFNVSILAQWPEHCVPQSSMWCMFIRSWILRTFYSCAYLLFVSFSPFVWVSHSLFSSTSCRSLFVYFSLSDKLASPACFKFSVFPLPFSIHLLSLFVSSFFIFWSIPTVSLPSPPPSLSLVLCLAYFRHHRLLLVFCFVCVVSLDLRKWIYIHDSVMWKTHFSFYSLRPSGETAHLYIHECTHPHKHAFTCIVHVTETWHNS